MGKKYIATVERDCEVSLPFKPRTKYKAEIISLGESSPPPSTSSPSYISDCSESMKKQSSEILDVRAMELSFQIRTKWGRNVTEPMFAKDIELLDKQGFFVMGCGEAVVVKNDTTSQRNYLRFHLENEDEYYLGCWNEEIYDAISPSLSALYENESYESLGLLIKEKFFEEFMDHIFENFDYKDCIRQEYSFEFNEYSIFLMDIEYWDDIK